MLIIYMFSPVIFLQSLEVALKNCFTDNIPSELILLNALGNNETLLI
jgi:hypothetical protein